MSIVHYPSTLPDGEPSTRAVYVAQCGGKYYVGAVKVDEKDNRALREKKIWVRYRDHRNGTGSAWTKLHGVTAMVAMLEFAGPLDEERLTKEWMLKHGIDHVRGAQYAQVTLTAQQRKELEVSLWHADNRCLACGARDHFVQHCVEGRSVDHRPKRPRHRSFCTRVVEWWRTWTTDASTGACRRCDRTSHSEVACFAKTTRQGKPIAA